MSDQLTGPVLVLEFTGLGPQAQFDAITEAIGAPALIRIDPVTGQRASFCTIEQQASAIQRQLAVEPVLILAQCSAARLALQLGRQLAETTPDRATAPQVILFDPIGIDQDGLREEFGLLAGRLDADPEQAIAQLGDQPTGAAAAARCCELLAALRVPLVQAYGDDQDAEELVDQLISRYAGWLRYLGAVIDCGPVAHPFPVSVLASAGASINLAGLLVGHLDIETAQLTATAGGLLEDPATIEHVCRLAGERSSVASAQPAG
ncbi:MAG: hypothetical protein ACR2N4_00215 [Jatrophihabitans sp.]